MRFCLVMDHAHSDISSGAARTGATAMRWLAQAGHEVRVVALGRHETPVELSLEAQIARQRWRARRRNQPARLEYEDAGVEVTTLLDEAPATMLGQVEAEWQRRGCEVLIVSGMRPVLNDVLAMGRRRGVHTVRWVRGIGSEEPSWFSDAQRVLMVSDWLAQHYRQEIGLVSTVLPPAMDWDEALAPEGERRSVTFVNPTLHKGVTLFARLADMLGSRRPDIPLLLVESGCSGEAMRRIRGLDLSRVTMIPATARPGEFLARTRLLLMPSLIQESFGRLAVEAMVNGIPPLVSDRGALPWTVGAGGVVLAAPAWLGAYTQLLPSEAEIEPWYEAVCRLWDDADAYEALAARAKAEASRRYDPQWLRGAYADYFTAVGV